MNINKINPATLKITDMRFADIDGAPKRCTLMRSSIPTSSPAAA